MPDREAVPGLVAKGIEVLATDTLMVSLANKVRLAETLVDLMRSHFFGSDGQHSMSAAGFDQASLTYRTNQRAQLNSPKEVV